MRLQEGRSLVGVGKLAVGDCSGDNRGIPLKRVVGYSLESEWQMELVQNLNTLVGSLGVMAWQSVEEQIQSSSEEG